MNYYSQIQNNYDIAVRYYSAKRNQLANYLVNNEIQNLELLNQEKIKRFVQAFKKYQEQTIRNASSNTGNMVFTYVDQDTNEKREINLGVTYAEIYAALQKNQSDGIRRFGVLLEKALESYFQELSVKTGKSVQGFIAQQTGQIVQQGFTFSKGQQIRADVTLGNVKNIQDTTMEITTTTQENINQILESEGSTVNDKADQIMRLMGQQGFLDSKKLIAGFSVKNYQDNIAYTHSEKLRKTLNEQYADPAQYPASQEEAYEQMMYFLSKYLIAITSPNIVGLITQGGLEWMDELLEKSRYIFHIRFQQKRGKNNRYWVQNSAIYLKRENQAAKISKWNSRGKKTGLIDLKIFTRTT